MGPQNKFRIFGAGALRAGEGGREASAKRQTSQNGKRFRKSTHYEASILSIQQPLTDHIKLFLMSIE